MGVPGADLGRRLKAVGIARPGGLLDAAGRLDWLRSRLARHQTPCVVQPRDESPSIPVGKPDKKTLRG